MGDRMSTRDVSFWMSTVDSLAPRRPLPGSLDADVAIVGAGYTGLWTAYYLAALDPSLRDRGAGAQIAGYGASGRNGGWCSALLPSSLTALAARHGRDATIAFQRAMNDTVDEVGRVAAAEGIDCHYAKGGTVVVARTPVQLARAQAAVEESPRLRARPVPAVRGRGVGALRGHRGARRVVHPALRGHPPRPAGARARRGGRAARGHDPRADAGDRAATRARR